MVELLVPEMVKVWPRLFFQVLVGHAARPVGVIVPGPLPLLEDEMLLRLNVDPSWKVIEPPVPVAAAVALASTTVSVLAVGPLVT